MSGRPARSRARSLRDLEPTGDAADSTIMLAKANHAFFSGDIETATALADRAASWSSKTARTGSCSTSSRSKDCSRTTGASGSNSCGSSCGAPSTRPISPTRVFDGHLCVAEYLLYGPVPYAEVLDLAASLRATATRGGRAPRGRVRGRAGRRSGAAGGRPRARRARAARGGRPASGHQRDRRRGPFAPTAGRAPARAGRSRRGRRAAPARACRSRGGPRCALHLLQRIYGTMILAADPRRTDAPRRGRRRRGRAWHRGLLLVLPGHVRGTRHDRVRGRRRRRRCRRSTSRSPTFSAAGCGRAPPGRRRCSKHAPTSPRRKVDDDEAAAPARRGGREFERAGQPVDAARCIACRCSARPVRRRARHERRRHRARSRTVTARDIELFTEISGDRNPLHYDEELAAALTLRAHHRPGRRHVGTPERRRRRRPPGPGSVFLETHWRFLAPVGPGDTITAEVEVLEHRDDKPITKLRTTITNQDGTVVLDGTAVVYREPLPSLSGQSARKRSVSSRNSRERRFVGLQDVVAGLERDEPAPADHGRQRLCIRVRTISLVLAHEGSTSGGRAIGPLPRRRRVGTPSRVAPRSPATPSSSAVRRTRRHCSIGASGMNMPVKRVRNSGWSVPHDSRMSATSASSASSSSVRARLDAPTLCAGAVEHEPGHSLGMARRIANRDRAALRDAEQRKLLDAERVDHRFEVAHPGVQVEVGDVPIRQPTPALVVADERVAPRQAAPPVTPHRARPVVVEMREPVGCLDEGRALSAHRVRKPNTVGRRAEVDRLRGEVAVARITRRDDTAVPGVVRTFEESERFRARTDPELFVEHTLQRLELAANTGHGRRRRAAAASCATCASSSVGSSATSSSQRRAARRSSRYRSCTRSRGTNAQCSYGSSGSSSPR